MAEGTPESSSEHNEQSLSKRARETGLTLKELVNSVERKAKAVAQQSSTQLKEARKDDEINAKDAETFRCLEAILKA